MATKKEDRKRQSASQRGAVAALGVGGQASEYTPEKFVQELIRLYEEHYNLGREAAQAEHKVTARVHYGMAHTSAIVLTDYYQHQGDPEQFDFWMTRRDETATRSMRRQSSTATMLRATGDDLDDR